MTRDEYLRAVPSRVDGVRHLDEVAILDLLDRVAAIEKRCTPGGDSEDPAEARDSVASSQPEAPGGAVSSHGAGAGEAETREGSEGEPATTATSPVPAPPASHARSFARHVVQVCSNFDGVLDPRKVEEEVCGLIVRLDSSADYGKEMRGKLYAARDALERAEADLAELRGLIRDLRAAWPGLHDDLAAMIYLKLDGQTLQKIDRTIEELAKAAGLVASAP